MSVTALGVDEVDSHRHQEFGKARDHITSRIGNGEVRACGHVPECLEPLIRENLLDQGPITAGDNEVDGQEGEDNILHVRRRRVDEFVRLLLSPPRESLLRPPASGCASLHMPTTSIARLDTPVSHDGGRETAAAYQNHCAARRMRHVIDEALGGIDMVGSEGWSKPRGRAI